MDEKKVREAIQYFRKMLFDMEEMGFKYVPNYYKAAIEALEKQLPKKPIEVNDAYTPKIGEFRVAKCPNCRKEVSDRFDVCLECKQNLDWSE